MPLHVPPGRTGRLWLQARIQVAGRAVDVLEQKRRALQGEVSRLQHLADETGRRWERACRDAETWYLRVALTGGQRQLEVTAGHLPGPTEARVVWHSTMGLAYPWEAQCLLGPAVDLSGFGESSALSFAIDAHREALVAAVEHAATQRAFDLVREDLAMTTRRLRAIERRWAPRLESALHDVELRLDAQERERGVRARWARDRAAEGERQ